MAEVTFPVELGGDGNTYSDDANPDTGMAAGGHRARFVPALGQALAMAIAAKEKAAAASESATTAGSSETNAANSASAAATSEANAGNAASAASTSASNAATSETNAGNAASAASTSASNAATSETNAGNAASAASTSASNAANSETNAGNSASAATTSASNAATSETNAGNSASAAASSESNAASSAGNALTAWNEIRSRYYGPLASDPTEDPLGNPLAIGDRYFNTTEGVEKAFDGTAWVINEISGHLADPDPHPQYLTSAEGDVAYPRLAGGDAANFAAMPQVGGVPILESDSNDDGEWTKLADGTLKVLFAERTFVIDNAGWLTNVLAPAISISRFVVSTCLSSYSGNAALSYAQGMVVQGFTDFYRVVFRDDYGTTADTVTVIASGDGRWK